MEDEVCLVEQNFSSSLQIQGPPILLHPPARQELCVGPRRPADNGLYRNDEEQCGVSDIWIEP